VVKKMERVVESEWKRMELNLFPETKEEASITLPKQKARRV
jgi:hypothetical protein